MAVTPPPFLGFIVPPPQFLLRPLKHPAFVLFSPHFVPFQQCFFCCCCYCLFVFNSQTGSHSARAGTSSQLCAPSAERLEQCLAHGGRRSHVRRRMGSCCSSGGGGALHCTWRKVQAARPGQQGPTRSGPAHPGPLPAPLLPLLVFSLIFTCQVHPHVGGFAFAGPSACDSPSPALPEPVFSCWLALSPNVTSSKKSSLVTSSKAAAPPTPHVPTLYRITLSLLSKGHSPPIGRFLFLF